MRVELECPRCRCRLAPPPDAPANEALERMNDEGPWYALGDGETMEDRIYTTLSACGITCPECDGPVAVSEENLGRMAMQVLGSW